MSAYQQVRTKARPRVYTTPSIATTWTYQPYLIPTFCNWQLGAIGSAEFRYEYGRIKQPDAAGFADIEPLDIKDHWVMIQWGPESSGTLLARLDGTTVSRLDGVLIGSGSATQTWVGIISGIQDGQISGAKAAGSQIVFANSPEFLLQRLVVTNSKVAKEGVKQTVGVGLSFNSAASDIRGSTYAVPNRDKTQNLFAQYADDRGARGWFADEILQYLLDEVVKESFQFGSFGVPSWSADTLGLDYAPIDIQTHGRNVWDVINDVIDRRRGLVWWLEPVVSPTVPPVPTGFRLRIATVLGDPQVIGTGEQIPANPKQITIDLRQSPHLYDFSLTEDSLNTYNQVIVEGAPQTVTFSIKLDKCLPDWTSEELDKYRTGAADITDYYNKALSDKRTRNDQIRQSDALRHVFTRFSLTPASLQGEGMGETKVLEDDGQNPGKDIYPQFFGVFPDTSQPWMTLEGWAKQPSPHDQSQINQWQPILRLENQTRLLPRVDYTQPDPAPDLENSAPEFMRPQAFWYDFLMNRWYRMDRLAAFGALDELKGDGGLSFSTGLRMHEHQCGFDLVPSDGFSHRYQVEYEFNGQDGNEVSHLTKGTVEPKDVMLTLCASAGIPLRIVYPEEIGPFTFDQRNQLILRLGDRARLDWVLGGTAFDVADDQSELKLAKHNILRDDRKSMYYVARTAWNWYSTRRRALQYTQKQIIDYSAYPIGTLVRNVVLRGDEAIGFQLARLDGVHIQRLDDILIGWGEREPINTVISSVHIDWLSGSTKIATQFAELDFQGLV